MTGGESVIDNKSPADKADRGMSGSQKMHSKRHSSVNDKCSICGAHADCVIDGVVVSGHFGSAHDLRRLVWIGAPDDAPAPGGICDDCVTKACETGCLEVFGQVTDRDAWTSVPSPSIAAYAALFATGFRHVDTLIRSETCGSCEPQQSPNADRLALVARLRAIVTGDAVNASTSRVDTADGWRAIDAGQAHALAARAIGVRMDPGALVACAQEWAAARKALDEEAEKLSEELLSIF